MSDSFHYQYDRASPERLKPTIYSWTRLRQSTRAQNENEQAKRRQGILEHKRGGSMEMNKFIDESAYMEWEKQLENASEDYAIEPSDLEEEVDQL
ncbi:hypothetical protein POMI540_4237 [Schizosaccharomyces pombe]|uniref:Uncharacterized protein C17C9.15c n=1 Tax=Schizosaccharomyces pombe (strain 972 / ATCC 24843) TaxID=284812 RepID=YDFF_SCHPO|nr:uncharacterized protein SPAC17C9.15c [Schizosaccharomyces pombe]Q10486.1 RecName: Full=Uncharacterized protein C17C9.15c [Schizosaccharomyces pombe 972h-]CAA97345.1 sequence orphan [Schizosaccharomyces pombe]|eukprot:NP_594591.1 uncharacterized protein SPAC17C9.15c [Schizosaccharomyces pombe]